MVQLILTANLVNSLVLNYTIRRIPSFVRHIPSKSSNSQTIIQNGVTVDQA